jgi:ketosteroid isomerase-like protein
MPERSHSPTDELEIRALVHRYADAASRRDPADVAGTFTGDGEWVAETIGQYRGRDAMMSFFTLMLEDWNVFLQGLLSGVVVLDAPWTSRTSSSRCGSW